MPDPRSRLQRSGVPAAPGPDKRTIPRLNDLASAVRVRQAKPTKSQLPQVHRNITADASGGNARIRCSLEPTPRMATLTPLIADRLSHLKSVESGGRSMAGAGVI